MTPRLAAVPGQIRNLLDALCAAGMVLYIAESYLYDFSSWETRDLIMALAGRTAWGLMIVVLWLVVRRTGNKGWVIALDVLAVFGTLMDEFSMMMIAVVVTYVYLGRRAGHGYVAAAVLGYASLFFIVPSAWSASVQALIMGNFLIGVLVPGLIGYVMRRHSEVLAGLASANSELAQANADLRAEASIGQELLLADERARTARELHDGLGHQLTVAGMSLDFAARTLDSHPDDSLAEVDAAREVVSGTLGDIRAWAQALQPVGGQEPGLAGLPSLVAGFGASGMVIDLDLPANCPELNRRQQLFVTRFAQEGLTNALKHARAGRVELAAWTDDDELVLELRNDGRLPAEVEEGFGLRSLRERAAELDGTVGAETDAGQFVLTGRLPLAGERIGVSVG